MFIKHVISDVTRTFNIDESVKLQLILILCLLQALSRRSDTDKTITEQVFMQMYCENLCFTKNGDAKRKQHTIIRK